MSALVQASARTFERLAGLPLEVDGYELEGLQLVVSDEYTRLTTVVRLTGGGEVGRGEDASYTPPDQLALRAAGPVLPLAGDWTLASFSAYLDGLDLCPDGMAFPAFRAFRRWTFESAALDLALRQAGCTLGEALDRTPQPVRFVVSPGPEASAAPVHERLARYPGMRLKLMPVAAWDEDLVAELGATGAVDVVDLKGQYPASVPVAVHPDAGLYRRVLEAFPDAWIEDPGITAQTGAVLAPHWARLTWDAPLRSVTDIAELAVRPRMINMKPSRFGTVAAVLDAYDHCERAGIGCYGGGQFELGPGRDQVQVLASLFHPDAPNDVAPAGYNEPVLRDDLPPNPLPAPEPRAGFA